ncbi:MAG: hypothetical protein QXI91_04195 [Candidatus Bathyarchaeia archaeon]
MIRFKKALIFLITIIVFLIVGGFAEATTLSFTVKAGQEETRIINLAVDDRVLIKFTVIGGLNFSMIYPNGTVRDFGERSDLRYDFVCDLEGEYCLRFSNVGSSQDKLVTLDYEVQHYIFGMPQMLFLTLIIVVVCVMAVSAFILMGKQH